MPEWIVTMFLNGWLVLATILFVVIIIRTFRPSARKDMTRNALIPFEDEGGDDGKA